MLFAPIDSTVCSSPHPNCRVTLETTVTPSLGVAFGDGESAKASFNVALGLDFGFGPFTLSYGHELDSPGTFDTPATNVLNFFVKHGEVVSMSFNADLKGLGVAVPEPGTAALVGFGLLGLLGASRRISRRWA